MNEWRCKEMKDLRNEFEGREVRKKVRRASHTQRGTERSLWTHLPRETREEVFWIDLLMKLLHISFLNSFSSSRTFPSVPFLLKESNGWRGEQESRVSFPLPLFNYTHPWYSAIIIIFVPWKESLIISHVFSTSLPLLASFPPIILL